MPEFLQGTVDAPVIGRVKKRYLFIPAGLAGAYVAWRWYQASRDAAQPDPGASGMYSTDDLSEYGLSTTGGAAPAGGNTGSTVTDGTNPNAIDDNTEWTAKAVERLTNQGYDGQVVTAALGEFLARRSLDPSEAAIARAALAVAGQPPVGGPYSVLEAATSAGSSAALPAPAGLRVTATGSNSVNLAWSPVTGAMEYGVWTTGTGTMSVRATQASVTVYGLKPNMRYGFQVAAIGSTGKVGAKTATVYGTTKNVALTRPATPSISALTRTSFRASVPEVKGATRYQWYLSGREVPGSDVPYRDFTGLKPNTKYAVGVKADAQGQGGGPMSATRNVTTKK